MNKLTAYTQDGQPIQELELGENVTAPLIYKIADIKKVGVKGGAFSKTIKLPATPNNNKFFGGLYDVNVDYTVYNTNLKTWVRLVVSDEEVMNGYMKLNKITVDDMDDAVYEIIIYDTSVDFWSNIEGKYVFELGNIDDLSHVWSSPIVADSWDTDWDQLGFFYPLMLNSVTTTGGTFRTYTERLYPAAFHKRLLDMVIADQGYTWSGTLKDNPIYEREIIPYTGDHPNVTLAEAEKRKFKAGWNAHQVGWSDFAPPIVNSGYIRNTNRTDWNYLGGAEFPNEAGGSFGFNDNFNLWASPIYTAPDAGEYSFGLNLKLQAELGYFKSGNPTSNLEYDVNFMVYAEIDTGGGTFTSGGTPLTGFDWWFDNSAPDTPLTLVTQNQTDNLIFPASSVGSLGGNTNGDFFVLQAGWTVRFYIGYSSQGLRRSQSGFPPYYTGNQDATKKFRIQTFHFKMLAGSFAEVNNALSAYGEDFLVPYVAWINKKMKQKDLFSDILARYNVHIYMNPDKMLDIVIDTGETFYDPDPADTDDWSDLKESDDKDEIKHMAELQNERLLLTYKESGDDYSKSYKTNTGEIYGQHEHRFDNAFVKGVKKIETPFSETPIVEVTEMYFPAVEAKEKDGAMRVLYAPKGGIELKDWNSIKFFALLGSNSVEFLGANARNYPYAGHFQNPNAINDTTVYNIADDNDLNFGSCAYLFPASLSGVSSLPVHTLEDRYWNNRIDQMNRGKMLTNKFDLTSRHINLIRRKPYTRIWTNNAYWQVNKINFEGNDNLRKLSRVELVSIENLRHIGGRIIKPTRPTILDHGGIRGFSSSTTNVNGRGSVNYNVRGFHNTIGSNTDGITITGNENTIKGGSKNVEIVNSHRVTVDGSNVTVIDTSDIRVTSSDVTIIRGVLYDGDRVTPLFNLVDGGEDTVRPSRSKFKINLIESGEDRNLNRFSDSSIEVIDSDTGQNEKI